MLNWNATELPERILNSLAECFEGFGETQRDRFDIAIGQDAVKQGVFENGSGDLDAQGVADGEIAGCKPSRVMVLGKEDRFVGSLDCPPIGNAAFECPTGGVLELTVMLSPEIIEQGLRLEPRFSLEQLLDVVPDLGKGIDPRAVVACRFSL